MSGIIVEFKVVLEMKSKKLHKVRSSAHMIEKIHLRDKQGVVKSG